MSMLAKNAINAYAQVGLDAKVAAASPHKLICMLFEGAIAAITKAKFHLEQKSSMSDVNDIAEKGYAVSKAIAIIEDGLIGSLNLEAGGEVGENLLMLYQYMIYRLTQANLNNDISGFDEVLSLLSQIGEAWESIGVRDFAKPIVQDEKTVNRSGAVTYGRV